jgi:hypothetical protein
VIVKEWNRSLNHDIPALAEKASPEIDEIWKGFLLCLEIGVKAFDMSILKDLQGEIPAMETIRDGVKTELGRVLRNISPGTASMHGDLVNVVQKKWEPTFKDALKRKGK